MGFEPEMGNGDSLVLQRVQNGRQRHAASVAKGATYSRNPKMFL